MRELNAQVTQIGLPRPAFDDVPDLDAQVHVPVVIVSARAGDEVVQALKSVGSQRGEDRVVHVHLRAAEDSRGRQWEEVRGLVAGALEPLNRPVRAEGGE